MMEVSVLSSLQYPVDDGRCNKKSQNNLPGIDIDQKCSQNTDQNDDEGNQPDFLVCCHNFNSSKIELKIRD